MSKMSKSSGNVLVIILVVCTVLVVLGAGFFFLHSSRVAKTKVVESQVVTNTVVPTKSKVIYGSTEQAKALATANLIRDALTCQYKLDGKYPKWLDGISTACLDPNKLDVPEASKNGDLNYQITNEGQSYYFEVVYAAGEGYVATEKGVDRIAISESTKNVLAKNTRDAVRRQDLENMKSVINLTLADSDVSNKALCNGLASCHGDSRDINSNKVDGSGWIKISFKNSTYFNRDVLPIDPVNDASYHYIYCASGSDWEIVSVLEAKSMTTTMTDDGGSDPTKYEVGSNFKLLGSIPGCLY